MARNYLITGGAGFIGSNYVYRLVERGEKVTVYDNLSRAGAPRISWRPGQVSALVTGEISRGMDVGNVVVQRDGKVLRLTITMGEPELFNYRIEESPNASVEARTLRAAWLRGK